MAKFKFEPAADKTTITYLDPGAAEIWIRLDKDDGTNQAYPTTKSSDGWAAVVPDSDVKPGMVAFVTALPNQAQANDSNAIWLAKAFHVFDVKSGTVKLVQPKGPRLRVSIFHFNSALVTKVDGGKYIFDQSIIDGLVDSRIDDYTMIANVAFDIANPLQPRWVGGPGGKAYDAKNNIEFLKQAVDALHAKNIQFCAGFVMVKPGGSTDPDSGPPFANLLTNQPDRK